MNKTVVDLASAEDSYDFTEGETCVLDNTTWRLARWTDRLKWWLRAKLRTGTYSRVVLIDHERGAVTLELVRWSWLRMKWVLV